jgi:predicted lipase
MDNCYSASEELNLDDCQCTPGIDNSLNIPISCCSEKNTDNKKRKLEHLSLEDQEKKLDNYNRDNEKKQVDKEKQADKEKQLDLESVFRNLNPIENMKKWCLISSMAYCDSDFVCQCVNSNCSLERDSSVDDEEDKEDENFTIKLKIKDVINEYFEESPTFFDSSSSGYNDAQVYFCFDKINKTLIVSCRGTESTQDIWSDLQFWQDTLYDVYYHNNYHKYRDIYKKPCLHTGFYNQYNTLKYIIYKYIHEYLYQVKDGNKDRKLNNKIIPRVVFTGHSLGGALATIAATCMSVQFMEHTNLIVECHTFGSPRVGNQSFVNIFNKFVHVSHRYVNDLDPVPMIPRFPGFYHVKGLQYICDAETDINDLNQKNNKKDEKNNHKTNLKKYQLFDYNKSYQIFQSWWKSAIRLFYSRVDDHSLKNYYFKLSNLRNNY